MKKLKIFIENFIIFGVGGIISQLIPIIMIPIVTRMLPNMAFYGIGDLSNTLVSFGSAVAVMGMYDAMYRMFFEKEDDLNYKKQVCSSALCFTFISSLFVSCLLIFGKKFVSQLFFGDQKYYKLIYVIALSIFANGLNSIIAAPTRMQNKRGIYIATNTLSPIIAYTITIVLIMKGFYVVALPLGAAFSGMLMMMVFYILNYQWFIFRKFNIKLLKELLKISIPLFPNFLIYWIFNSSDRIMITNILSVGDAGVYSVGAKLGHVSQLIYMAFSGGWQFFAFSTMKEKDQVKTNSLVFEYLGVISYVACSVMCILAYPVFTVLFEEDYVPGYIVSPYLFLAPLLQMLFQVASNQFLVIKKTWPILFILGQGAILNIILNLIFIPRIGIEGAAIASLLGYLISDLICIVVLMKIKLIMISRRFIIMTIMIIGYILIWRIILLYSKELMFLVLILFICCTAFMYRDELGLLISLIHNNEKEN